MSEGRKTAVTVLVAILALAGVVTWLVLGIRESEKLDESIHKKNAQLKELQGKIAAIPQLRQERERLGGELNALETILPNDRELNKIFDTLSEFEKETDIEIRAFSPAREKKARLNAPQASYKKVSYNLDLVGDFFSMVKFLNLLENHNRFIQVDSLNIKQKDENNPVNQISLACSTFVFDPKAKAKRRTTARRSRSRTKRAAARKKAPDIPFNLEEELASRYVFREDVKQRDPFSNPLTRRIDVAKLDKPDATRRLTSEQEKNFSKTISRQLKEVGKLISDGKLDEAETLLDKTRGLMDADFRDPGCRKSQLGFGRRAQRLSVMLRTAKGERLYKNIQRKYEKMAGAFEAGDYDEVYRLHALVDEAMKHGAGTVKPDGKTVKSGNEPMHERLGEVVKACGVLVKRADARREFADVAIKIQGTFWSGGKDGRKAAVIINGQMLVEGERLKADGVKGRKGAGKGVAETDAGIIVKKIERDGVTFLYKNEFIQRCQFEEN